MYITNSTARGFLVQSSLQKLVCGIEFVKTVLKLKCYIVIAVDFSLFKFQKVSHVLK